MKVSDIINIINTAAPEKYAMKWDNSGFLIGDRDAEVRKVLLALDVTEATAKQAERDGCDMIVSHHPMFFGGIKAIDYSTPVGRTVKTLIKNDIAVYACHTNMDAAENGINSYLAGAYGLSDVTVLEPNPDYPEVGIGRVGTLEREYTVEELCEMTKKLLGTPQVRLVKGGKDSVRRIAVASGSCAEFIPSAMAQGAEVIITADMKYHDSLDAFEAGMNVIDAGHYPTEYVITGILEKLLKDVETVRSENRDVFRYI